jgi:uncharacterized protein (DUF433 family)
MRDGLALAFAACGPAETAGASAMDGSETGDFDLLGIGLYTAAEASCLTGIPRARLRRWLRGYTYWAGGPVASVAPVWRRQVPNIDGTVGLGFLDLIEARFVDAFRRASVPWPVIRRCAEQARALSGSDHPFSSQRFRADGRTIFAEVVDQTGERQFLDPAKSQFAFARIIGASLYAGIEFSDRDMPVRWWPLGRDTPVVIDPTRAFGQPIVSDAGIPTSTLVEAVKAEGSAVTVAHLFQVKPRSVRAALRFEKQVAERLAAA